MPNEKDQGLLYPAMILAIAVLAFDFHSIGKKEEELNNTPKSAVVAEKVIIPEFVSSDITQRVILHPKSIHKTKKIPVPLPAPPQTIVAASNKKESQFPITIHKHVMHMESVADTPSIR